MVATGDGVGDRVVGPYEAVQLVMIRNKLHLSNILRFGNDADQLHHSAILVRQHVTVQDV